VTGLPSGSPGFSSALSKVHSSAPFATSSTKPEGAKETSAAHSSDLPLTSTFGDMQDLTSRKPLPPVQTESGSSNGCGDRNDGQEVNKGDGEDGRESDPEDWQEVGSQVGFDDDDCEFVGLASRTR